MEKDLGHLNYRKYTSNFFDKTNFKQYLKICYGKVDCPERQGQKWFDYINYDYNYAPM